MEIKKQKKKPQFGVLAGCLSDAMSLIQISFDNSNSYIIYLWCMIDKHQLIESSMMDMLAEGVEACSGVSGIPSAITTESRDSSMASKSFRLPFTTSITESNEEYTLAQSIMQHSNMVCNFKDYAAMKKKRQHKYAIQSECGQLRA
jgi:hypothetical protein